MNYAKNRRFCREARRFNPNVMGFLFAALIVAPIVCKEGMLIFTLTDLSEDWDVLLMVGFLFLLLKIS